MDYLMEIGADHQHSYFTAEAPVMLATKEWAKIRPEHF